MQVKAPFRWAILPFLIIFLFFNGYGHFLLHEFMEHQDTVHSFDKDTSQKHFESEHIHCDILDVHLAVPHPLILAKYQLFNPYTIEYLMENSNIYLYLFRGISTVRGPPL